MKKHLLGVIAALSATTTGAAPFSDNDSFFNNDGFYAGAGISRYRYAEPGAGADFHLATLELNGGFWFHPLLSAEMRVGTGLGDQESAANDVLWQVNLDSFASVYWRPEWVNESAKLYGLLGYTQVDIGAEGTTAAGAPRTQDLSEDGFSFGAGIGFFYDQNLTVNLEWKQLVDADSFEMSGFSAGLDYRF